VPSKTAPNRSQLTERRIEALPPPAQGERDAILWDTELPGFGARVKPTATPSYSINCRNAHGTEKRHTLGRHGPLTAERARDTARTELAEVRAGADPAKERTDQRAAPTMADPCERYMVEHAQGKRVYAPEMEDSQSRRGVSIAPSEERPVNKHLGDADPPSAGGGSTSPASLPAGRALRPLPLHASIFDPIVQ